jgi:predicted nucleotidyltransferase
MDSVREEIEVMKSFIIRKRKERSEKLKLRLSTARNDFNRIVDMIIVEFRPERIYQWGSLIEGKTFQEISDIDIAIAGIEDPKTFLKLYSQAKKLTSFPLHIVQVESIHPSYSQDIIAKGVIVYERPV